MKFPKLNSKILGWIKKKGFLEATLPQTMAIPKIIEGKDTLIMAPTGFGKTEAAVFAVFDKMLENKDSPGIRALYITPLKSLNRDLFGRILDLANHLDIDVDLRHGDTPQRIRRQQLIDPCKLMIMTPETLQAVLSGKKFRNLLKNIEWVVVDEIHELADNKRGSQLSVGLERLRELTVSDFQRIGLSATIGDPEKISKFLTGNKDCEIIDARAEKAYDISVEHPKFKKGDKEIAAKIRAPVSFASSLRRIKDLVDESESAIVFVNTRETAEALATKFKRLDSDYPVAVHHSSLSKKTRIDVEDKFKDGELKAIISTSSLELGIDVGTIDIVVQYGSPRQATKLIQRVGRASHSIGKTSRGVMICSTIDDYLEAKAILKKSEEGWLEEPKIPEKPFDVLCHQIVGMCMDANKSGEKAELENFFQISKRAYPFRNMTEKEFKELMILLENTYLIGKGDNGYYRTRKGLMYYFENLSTIPHEKNFIVLNKEMNARVGVLHQGFVAKHIKRNAEFIMRGETWKVVNREEDTINVIPTKDSGASIPSWEGELIPVSKEVANVASGLRKKLKFKSLEKQRKDFVVPDEKTLYLESFENYIILHCPYGNKINQTLAKTIGVLISSKVGSSIMARNDTYRIIFKIPDYFGKDLVVDAINELEPEWIEDLLLKSLKNTSMFEFRFYQIAKRFGIVRKDADFSSATVSRLVDIYEDTAVVNETINELFREKLDLNGSIELVRKIKSNKISLVSSSSHKLSPLGIEGLDYSAISLIKPGKKVKEIYDAIRKRILKKKFWFACMNCSEPFGRYLVRNAPEKIKCRNCGAKLVGFVDSRDYLLVKRALKKYVNKRDLSKEELELIENFSETAELVLNYGKLACFVMAGYGIGATTAKRILSRYHGDEKALLKEMVRAERNFIKNRQFWAD